MNQLLMFLDGVWRRFRGYHPSREAIQATVDKWIKAEAEQDAKDGGNNFDFKPPRPQFCCVIFWDEDDDPDKIDRPITVTGEAMCDKVARENGAKRRPLLKGRCA